MRARAIWRVFSVLLFVAALSVADLAAASGSYRSRPPRPPFSIDRSAYELGKQVFAGEFVRQSEPGDAAIQSDLLIDLHESLPRKARAKSELVDYAGQLNDQQIEALRYFLKKRYKIK